MLNKSDQEILLLINDEAKFDLGFNAIVLQYQERLYWHIRRLVHVHEDADDVLQNVFIKVFKNIKGFKAESKIYTWLYRIATNEALSFLRKKNNKPTSDHDTDEMPEIIAAQFFDVDKAIIQLKAAIETLPEKQRAVFNMRYYDEISYKDMAEIFGGSVGSLKASFHHAMKKVENYLKETCDVIG